MRQAAMLLLAPLLLGGCLRFPAQEIPLGPPAAQRVLEKFARRLLRWEVDKVEALLFGGASHPLWRRQRLALEGRGIRFVETRVGAVRRVGSDAAVGAFRFRLRGGEADPRPRAARVVLVLQGGAWKITFWGAKDRAKRHLEWVLRGGDPLSGPGLNQAP